MNKRSLIRTTLISLGVCLYGIAVADNANIHGVGGVNWARVGGEQYLNLGVVTNAFNTTSQTNTSAVWGLGVGYQWDSWAHNRPFSLGMDITTYYTQSSLSGVETPAVNIIAHADTLNYRADNTSWAWMFEPKLAYTEHVWQPYVVGGIGFSGNRLSRYRETPSNASSSAVATNVFANHATASLAWEVGAGVQRVIHTLASGQTLLLAGEYRYMDWGSMNLGTTASQTTQHGPAFGHLKTNLLDLRLSLQF